MSTPAFFTFNGQRIALRPGQSLAAALIEAGHRGFRETSSGAMRSIFCGMGVCQDCLVTVDGATSQRACMTPARAGQEVITQKAALVPGGASATVTAPQARRLSPDVLVIGGGIGGLNAAIAAKTAGASVVLIDERKVPGGQFLKQAAEGIAPLDRQQEDGRALLAQARALGVQILGSVTVWGAFDGLLFLAEHQDNALILRPKTAIVATGAYERPWMVPGWTLPGVMTTGAAQTLWRSYRTLPGQRVAIFGTGPLNLQVADELSAGGAAVLVVGELAPAQITSPRKLARLVWQGPKLVLKGLGMTARLRRRQVPVQYGARLERIETAPNGLRISWVQAGHAQSAVVDAVCMNAGFEPQNEILRLLGADLTMDPIFGHLRARRDATLQSSVKGLYAIGDCAGLGGAPAAQLEGQIAGRAAALASGGKPAAPAAADLAQLKRHRAFQAALWSLYRPGPRPLGTLADETIICRCEEQSLAQLKQGLEAKPDHAGTLKRATRVGMGRCQGRYCASIAARLVAETTGTPLNDRSLFYPRVPIKPVKIAAILAVKAALEEEGLSL